MRESAVLRARESLPIVPHVADLEVARRTLSTDPFAAVVAALIHDHDLTRMEIARTQCLEQAREQLRSIPRRDCHGDLGARVRSHKRTAVGCAVVIALRSLSVNGGRSLADEHEHVRTERRRLLDRSAVVAGTGGA